MTKSTVKILCIDDEADIRRDVAEELQDAGYETIEACDGVDGLNAIIRHKPHLVVSDLTMPRMDGHALLGKLRNEHPELSTLPFIFLTAMSDREHILEGKRLGADDYLTKPIDFDLLLATIEARLSQIERMNSQRDAQLVKLYQSLNNPTNADSGPTDREQCRVGSSAQAPNKTPEPEKTQNAQRLEERITTPDAQGSVRSLAHRSGGTFVAGKIQIVGLDEIRVALGKNWSKHSRIVAAIAESTIRKHLSKEDAFEVSQDNEYLICFGALDEQAAALKAQSIAREIQTKALGTDSLDSQLKENCAVTSDVHEVSIDKDEIDESENIFDLVMTRVDEAAKRTRKIEREGMTRLLKNCHIVPVQIATQEGADAPVAIAEFDEASRLDIAALKRARPHSDDLTADLDALKLGQTTALLCEDPAQNQAVLLVNVSFSTLRSQPLLERYLTICAALTEATKSSLAFNVGGIPKGYPFTKVQLLIHALRRHCRLVTLELDDLSLGNIELNTLQLSIVTCNYQSFKSKIDKLGDRLKNFVAVLHDQKGRLLVYDVPDQSETDELFRQGVMFAARCA